MPTGYRWEQASRWSWDRWRLASEGREVAVLRLRGWGFGGATLSFGAHRWTLATRGILRWRIELEDEMGVARAVMPLDWRGTGVVRWADGREFAWVAESWWATRFVLRQRGAGDVARVTGERWFRLDARVDVLDAALPEDELVALLAMGWYATILMTAGSSVVTTG